VSNGGELTDPLADEYELRLTWRALDDVGVPDGLPGIIEDIRAQSSYWAIIDRFAAERTETPQGTETIGNVGRGDIYSLHGPGGFRAATWFDASHAVCWLLAFTPEHEYTRFEQRAANDELLPDERDYAQLIAERDASWHVHRAGAGLNQLVNEARRRPNTIVPGALAGSIPCQVFAEVLVLEPNGPHDDADIWVLFRTYPPIPETWLPSHFEAELIAHIDGAPTLLGTGRITFHCDEFPVPPSGDGEVQYRPVETGKEIVVRLRL
jgi:hypothetical protein